MTGHQIEEFFIKLREVGRDDATVHAALQQWHYSGDGLTLASWATALVLTLVAEKQALHKAAIDAALRAPLPMPALLRTPVVCRNCGEIVLAPLTDSAA